MKIDNRIRSSVRRMLTAACLCAATSVAMAGQPADSYSLACARRDLQVVMLIEAYGQAQTVATQKLADAFYVVMRARKACDEGRVNEAIALYDGITFAPVLTRAMQ